MKRWGIKIEKQRIIELQNAGLTQTDIAKTLEVSVTTIERRIKKFGLQGYSPVRYDLMNVEDPIFCYLLGWFCTDGYLTKGNRVSIRVYEEDVISKLTKYFNCKMYTIPRTNKPTLYECYFPWAPEVFKNAFDVRKTTSVKVPPIPIENSDMFLRGVIEGDGCIRIPGKSRSTLIRIFTNSSAFNFMLQTLISSKGFKIRSRVDRMGWELSTGDLSFLKFVYTRHLDFVCKRKFSRAEEWLSI